MPGYSWNIIESGIKYHKPIKPCRKTNWLIRHVLAITVLSRPCSRPAGNNIIVISLSLRLVYINEMSHISEKQDVNIFYAIYDYIKHTHRFNWFQQVFALKLLSTYWFCVIVMFIMKYIHLCSYHLNATCEL